MFMALFGGGGSGGSAGSGMAPSGRAGQPVPVSFHYSRKQLLSPAERSFLGVLDLAVAGQLRVFTKVRLADVLEIQSFKSQWRTHFNRIAAKHVDFILCEPNSLVIRFAIELDDRSHARLAAQASDAFKNQAFAAAGIPLVRFAARQSYSVAEVRARFIAEPPPIPPSFSPIYGPLPGSGPSA